MPSFMKSLKTVLVAVLAFTFLSVAQGQTTTDETTTTPTIGGTGGSTSEEYLYYIMQNTYGILLQVNNLPTYMQTLVESALAWLQPDQTETTANMQANFASLGNAFKDNLDAQRAVQPQLMADILDNPTTGNLPFANDLVYQNLLGMPIFAKDPRDTNNSRVNSKYNYLKNAVGANYKHAMPGKSFAGSQDAQERYAGFYATIKAAQSFNGYILSSAYTEAQAGGTFSTLQSDLITQASSSDWFAQVASESIGVVLRQILMYQSQSFVLLTQLLQTQKDALYAQTIANALLILNTANAETVLLDKATGNAR